MSNVLTTEEKKKLSKRLFARLVFASSVMLMLGAFVASVALAPTFLSVSIARASLGAAASEESDEAREEGAEAARAQALLDGLAPLLTASTTPSVRLAGALALAPSGVSVTGIRHRSGSTELSGTATGREVVNEFRLALEGSGLFSSVTVPVTALVGAQDGRFTMTLTHEE